MKNFLFIVSVIILISCKKEVGSIKSDKIKANFNKEKEFVVYGDSLVSDSVFVYQIKNSSDVKLQRALLSKMKFNYDKFMSWTYDSIKQNKVGFLTLKFEKEDNKNSNAEINTWIKLSIYKNNIKTNKINVYRQENYSEALVTITNYFYIDSKFNLWILGLNEDEEGIKVKFWNHYKIDEESGKINLIKNSFSSNLSIENGDREVNNSWRGKYFFERTNRDDLKTSFEISINNLKNISLVYVSDGEKPEVYKDIVGEMISDDKMKITFNKKYGDMGIIYIQKNGNNYIISGDPISSINPGNDDFPLKKMK